MVGPFRFRAQDGSVLVTNDWGCHLVLDPDEFRAFAAGRASPGSELWTRLQCCGFVGDHLDFADLAAAARARHLVGWRGPNLHQVALTNACDGCCAYCSDASPGRAGDMMTAETARGVIDFIFATPSQELTIEFTGGEPLLNWPVLREAVARAKAAALATGRRLRLSVISNFSRLDDEKLEALLSEGVALCTSLDGPREVHDAQRGPGSHARTAGWLGRLRSLAEAGRLPERPNAVCTVTRRSLAAPEAVVEEFAGLGLERVQLGPLDRLGHARRAWGTLGYAPSEYLEFYARALDRILALNASGARLYEKGALIFLTRILRREHWRYPNVDTLCRLAYDARGGIYPCDEARLLADDGDAAFRLGDAARSSYADVLASPAARLSVAAAFDGSQPMCSRCAYGPYCRVSPALHYAVHGEPWGRLPQSDRCEIYMGVFDLLFERLRDPARRALLEAWFDHAGC